MSVQSLKDTVAELVEESSALVGSQIGFLPCNLCGSIGFSQGLHLGKRLINNHRLPSRFTCWL
jgi:hypothetical protein